MGEMIVTTTQEIPGYKVVEVKGLARGGIVRATHVGRDIMAFLKNLKGGEVQEYTQMLAEAREEALRRMMLHAQDMGANAVIGVRFMTSAVASGMAEIYAYGTAVVVERVKEE